MKIYIDLLFIINAVFDFILCVITGRIMHHRLRVGRLLVAAFVGGAFGIARLFIINSVIYTIMGIFVPAFMLMIAFGKMRPFVFLGTYLLLMGSSFAAGGFVFATGELLEFGLSKKILFSICFAAFFISFFCFGDFSGANHTDAVYISLVSGSDKYTLRLLCDSGCLVCEPISGLPVVLVSSRVFDGIYGEKITDTENAVKHKSRLVPVKTATGNDIIPAVLPEKLEYTYKGAVYPCRAMVGRSGADCFAGYDGIFPKTLL